MVNHSLIIYLIGLISLFKWSLIWSGNFKCIWSMLKNFNHFVFSRGHATLHLAVSVGWSVSPLVHLSHNLFELRAVFAQLLLPIHPWLDCHVSGLVSFSCSFFWHWKNWSIFREVKTNIAPYYSFFQRLTTHWISFAYCCLTNRPLF